MSENVSAARDNMTATQEFEIFLLYFFQEVYFLNIMQGRDDGCNDNNHTHEPKLKKERLVLSQRTVFISTENDKY